MIYFPLVEVFGHGGLGWIFAHNIQEQSAPANHGSLLA